MTDDTCNLKLLRVRTRTYAETFPFSSVIRHLSPVVLLTWCLTRQRYKIISTTPKEKPIIFGGRRNNLLRNRLRLNKRPKSVRMSIIMSIFAQTITKTVKNTIHIINNN